MHGQPQDTPPLVALSPGEQSQAMQRYGILQPHLEHSQMDTFFRLGGS
jgi:hypothetical protein